MADKLKQDLREGRMNDNNRLKYLSANALFQTARDTLRREKAAKPGEQIRVENGVQNAVHLIHELAHA